MDIGLKMKSKVLKFTINIFSISLIIFIALMIFISGCSNDGFNHSDFKVEIKGDNLIKMPNRGTIDPAMGINAPEITGSSFENLRCFWNHLEIHGGFEGFENLWRFWKLLKILKIL